MTALDRLPRVTGTPTSSGQSAPWWLRLSVPLVVLGIGGSVAGILVDRVYADETASWRAEAVGQDIANLVVLSVLLVLAAAAAQGSVAGFLGWLGTITYAAYTYAIYVFDVHFGPLFLLHVAVFAMAVWALIGGLAGIDPIRVRAAFVTTPFRGFVSVLLVVIAGAFALLWLSEDIPALIDGRPSDALVESGLPTNPVHVLDLSLFLPTAVLAGVLLRRGRAWGHVLAPVVLVAMAAISAGIVSLTFVHIARDQGGSLGVASVIGVLGLVQALAAWQFLSGLARTATLGDVLRDRAG
jgi:hypothetical protein